MPEKDLWMLVWHGNGDDSKEFLAGLELVKQVFIMLARV